MKHLAVCGGKPVRTRPFPSWPQYGAQDERAVALAVRGGVWGYSGKHTARFEKRFAEYVGARYGVTCTNGTAALMVALLACGVEEGAEVIVPCYTFIATASCAVWVNAIPVFVDIDPETFNLDAAAVAAAITPRTRAIIPVHFGGVAANMDAINRIARRHGLFVIEDACHAHGAEYRGRRCGSLGDLGCFSFQSTKNLNCGEGGFIAGNDEKLTDLSRAFTHIGRLKHSAWYEHVVAGGNFRLTDIQSALLLSQLRRLDRQTDRRNENGLYLTRELGKIEGIVPQKRGREITRCSHHIFIFRVDSKRFPVPRDRFLEALQAEGIPGRPGYAKPLNQQPVFVRKNFGPFAPRARKRRDLDYGSLRFPVAEKLCSESVYLLFDVMLGARRDMADIVKAVRKIRAHYRELL